MPFGGRGRKVGVTRSCSPKAKGNLWRLSGRLKSTGITTLAVQALKETQLMVAKLPPGRCHVKFFPPWKIRPLRCGLLSKFFDQLFLVASYRTSFSTHFIVTLIFVMVTLHHRHHHSTVNVLGYGVVIEWCVGRCGNRTRLGWLWRQIFRTSVWRHKNISHRFVTLRGRLHIIWQFQPCRGSGR